MEVICLEDTAFYALIEQVVERIKEKHAIKEDRWISPEEAMQKLRISSKTTLQKLRDEGKVRFSHPQPKIILYDVESIYEYLEKHVNETF
ncbi:MAG: helix-turn-helix domain-containing protein [Chitinophagaceae bacterium]|nr:helix-turn-helix domain-containing protein [Chitinophagaceae bacterium]